MELRILAIVIAAGLLGPLLAAKRSWRIPVVFGELTAGVLLGRTGFGVVDPSEPMLSFLAEMGFALVMFVAGSHVPLRKGAVVGALPRAVLRVALVAVIAVGLAVGIAAVFHNPHWPLYAVLMASSSAALALPVTAALGLTGRDMTQLIPQLALADALCIIALPMAIDREHVARAALGALAVVASGAVVAAVLWRLDRVGVRRRVHDFSEDARLAVELRISTMVLFALCALAVTVHVSIMLAGFVLGLGIAAIGNPRRLAKQLFALTEGFLGPIFFVWLGASLDLRLLGAHPEMIALGVALALGALAAHAATRAAGQPVAVSALAAAQLGLPIAALQIGQSLHYFLPGEAGAVVVSALLTVTVAILAAGALARRQAPT
ncbi:cation:proton antiporter [Cumulibacter manganitolerans]|uniref:cation:proton antiporter n=1 Tax=Cumulibacter manganitolerans TaxID=1884992 RepID=UPI001296581F|nr:cation:proton antiporter [Cumulibacter manganitolerans]